MVFLLGDRAGGWGRGAADSAIVPAGGFGGPAATSVAAVADASVAVVFGLAAAPLPASPLQEDVARRVEGVCGIEGVSQPPCRRRRVRSARGRRSARQDDGSDPVAAGVFGEAEALLGEGGPAALEPHHKGLALELCLSGVTVDQKGLVGVGGWMWCVDESYV